MTAGSLKASGYRVPVYPVTGSRRPSGLRVDLLRSRTGDDQLLRGGSADVVRRPDLRAQRVIARRQITKFNVVQPFFVGAAQRELTRAVHRIAVRFDQQRPVLGIGLDGYQDANCRGLNEVASVEADFDDVARIAVSGPCCKCEKGGETGPGDGAAIHVSSCVG